MKYLILTLAIISSVAAKAQNDMWDYYNGQFEKGPGLVMLNMSIANRAPLATNPYLLVTGVGFDLCDGMGFPQTNQYDALNLLQDDLEKELTANYKYERVGIFICNCQKLMYFYINDTLELRSRLKAFYAKQDSGFTPVVRIKEDGIWNTYFRFLYPSDQMLNHMQNQKFVDVLQGKGDDITQPRPVDHWAYFKTEADGLSFIKQAAPKGYSVVSNALVVEEAGEFPYEVHIQKVEPVDLKSIDESTEYLRLLAEKLNGEYDGWETIVKSE